RLSALARRPHAVLATVSSGYPPLKGRSPRVTHPFATKAGAEAPTSVRLACVRHAASVRSEPGSNSQVHALPHQTPVTQHPAEKLLGARLSQAYLPRDTHHDKLA